MAKRAAEPTINPEPRVLPTTGIHNFRDYGGYPVAAGGRLKRGLLFRSGEHAQATESDLKLIGDLGLSTVVDLRGSAEREKSPCRRPQGFSARVLCAEGETSPASAPHADAAANAFDAAAARRNMLERYADVPFRPLLSSVYREYFKALAESNAPTLVYCTAGKDRTGVLVALLHAALGVHPDDIFADYLLTNTAGDVEARIAALRYDLSRRFGGPMPEEAVRVVAMVEPEFLQAAFDAVTERHGSVMRYLDHALGVTPEVRKALAARLIE
ncbi:MAG: tyrosine-protein phosphatase [Dehalococcoidia bacterium]